MANIINKLLYKLKENCSVGLLAAFVRALPLAQCGVTLTTLMAVSVEKLSTLPAVSATLPIYR